LIGSEAVESYDRRGFEVHGADNNMRREFFGPKGDTRWNLDRLKASTRNFTHHEVDIRDRARVFELFRTHRFDLIIHCAAQPSHDRAAAIPLDDFDVNAVGTLNLLEATRRHAPEAVFCFMSTNKVYGDAPNEVPLVETATRGEYARPEDYNGITEHFRIDQCLHSLFGASKLAADVAVQEYGRYFGLRTVSFRGGCLTGPRHAGARLHGFLSYLMRCTITGEAYTVYGYGGRQVRDNLHSADLVRAFAAFHANPRSGAVYNIGGGRHSNCSMLEAIELCQHIAGRPLEHTIVDDARVGDHRWWISDLTEFQRDYPDWSVTYDVPAILAEIHEYNADRWAAEPSSTAGAR
jgi:CDP-paratose 2-epimerase